MADYCSQCTPVPDSDINLLHLALKLKRGYEVRFICEGCANRALFKDEDGKLYLGRVMAGTNELQPVEVDIESLS